MYISVAVLMRRKTLCYRKSLPWLFCLKRKCCMQFLSNVNVEFFENKTVLFMFFMWDGGGGSKAECLNCGCRFLI